MLIARPTDAYTNQSRGMAFVRYTNVDEARSAIQCTSPPGAAAPRVPSVAADARVQR